MLPAPIQEQNGEAGGHCKLDLERELGAAFAAK